jgi:uncharacterized membrane protein
MSRAAPRLAHRQRSIDVSGARSSTDFSNKRIRSMRLIAYLLAIICVIAAVMYFVMPAGQLPTFMPGYEVASTHIHTKHAVIALVAGVVLFLIGWVIGRR